MTLPTSREQPRPAAIGRDVDVLVDVGAVELQRIVPPWPSTVSLPSPGFQTKVSLPRREGRVVAATAVDEVVAGAADDDVIAVAAVEREVGLAGMQPRSVDGVVAGASIDDEQSRCRVRRR